LPTRSHPPPSPSHSSRWLRLFTPAILPPSPHSGRLGILPTACLRAPLPLGRSSDGIRPLQPACANTAGTPTGYTVYQTRVVNHFPVGVPLPSSHSPV